MDCVPDELILRAVQTSGFAITLADARQPDLPLVYVNRAFETMTGYSTAEILGRNCRFLQGPETDPEGVAKVRETLQCEISGTVLLLNYRKDGTRFWNRFQLSPVRDGAGRLTAYLGMQVDLTDDVERMSLELERQKLETLGRLAGGVAHELNNALQPIRLNADLLAAPELDLAGEVRRRCVETILENTDFARDVVNQILSFARRDDTAGRVYDARQVLSEAVEFAAEYIPSSVIVTPIGFEPDAPVGGHHVTLNRTALFQVMANLFKNAADATGDKGKITVTLALGAHSQAGPGPSDESRIVVTVADDGCGMAPETMKRIFEPFFTTKAPGRGTGLGLSTIYGIVERWGGRIGVESTLGDGTAFRLTIPSFCKT